MCQSDCGWASFSFISRKNRELFGTSQQTGILYFLWENLFPISFILMKNTYTDIVSFSDYIFCIYPVTSSSCDCDYICHYSAASY